MRSVEAAAAMAFDAVDVIVARRARAACKPPTFSRQNDATTLAVCARAQRARRDAPIANVAGEAGRADAAKRVAARHAIGAVCARQISACSRSHLTKATIGVRGALATKRRAKRLQESACRRVSRRARVRVTCTQRPPFAHGSSSPPSPSPPSPPPSSH